MRSESSPEMTSTTPQRDVTCRDRSPPRTRPAIGFVGGSFNAPFHDFTPHHTTPHTHTHTAFQNETTS